MKVRLKLSALRKTRWYEYLVRFILGGLVTVAAGLIANKCGPVIGGLFLAFPSIFPASVTLVQTHKDKEEKKEHLRRDVRKRVARQAAGVTAMGTAWGSAGLVGFAFVVWAFAPRMVRWLVLFLAMAVWVVVNMGVWWFGRRRVRARYRRASGRGGRGEVK